MKSKKICCGILSVSLSLILVMATCVIGFAKTEPTIISSSIPQTYKLGDRFGEDYNVSITVSGLDDYLGQEESYYGYITGDEPPMMQYYCYGGYGGGDNEILEETETFVMLPVYAYFNVPGKVTFNPLIFQYGTNGTGVDPLISELDPIEVIVEEPIIETNAPCFVAANSEFTFSSALTNTALENKTVTEFIDTVKNTMDDNKDPFTINPIGYQPSVEILEGQSIIAQSNQDYSNILNSSETLTFTGTGIVKLKVKYNQIYNSEVFIRNDSNGYPKGWAPEGEFDLGNDLKENRGAGVLYSPEKIITIYVSENGEADVSLVKKDLNNTLTQAQALNAADYTAESYKAVAAAMKKANAVLNDPNATAEEVLAAKTELETAVNNLQTGTTSSADNNSEKNNGQIGSTTETIQIPKTGKSGFAVVDIALLGVMSSASYFVIRGKRKRK